MTNFTLTSKLYFLFTAKICLYLFFFFIGLTSIAQGTLAVISNGNSVLTGSANSPAANNNTDFGNVEVGSNKANTFVLDNTVGGGNTADELTGITVVISGSGSSNFTPNNSVLGNLKGNATPLNHIITFTPNSPGIKTATVTITFTKGTNSPYTFTIQGNGITPTPEIEITDNGNTIINNSGNFNFGTIPPNSTTTETFKIKNTSNASTTLNLTGLPIVDIIGDSEFTITAQPIGNSVIGGNFLTFTVEYHPLALGSHTVTISIGNDDPDGSENPYTFTIQGTADNITYVPTTSSPDWNVSTISSGISQAFTMIYGPDGFIWITEKSGNVVKVDPVNGGAKVNMLNITSLVTNNHSQNGLLGMAVHPDLYADVTTTTNNYVYLAYSYTSGSLKVRIARYTYIYNGGNGYLDSGSAVTVLEGFEGSSTGHSAGRLVIGPPNVPVADQKLYYSIGDQEKNRNANACNEIRAQYLPTSPSDYSDYEGKIIRMNLDGTIPSDNPILNGVQSHVYTYGHRNPQGLVFGSDGTLYSSEHGDKVDDEINIIESGKNYGWPLISGYNDDLGYAYCNWSSYTGSCGSYNQNTCPGPYLNESTSFATISTDFIEPIGTYNSTVTIEPTGGFLTWPTVAPSNIAIYEAGLIPDWDKSLISPTLKGNKIFRSKLDVNGTALESQVYEEFHSASGTRYRDVTLDPDGITLYTVTDAGNVEKLQYVGTTLSNNSITKSEFKFSLVPNPASNNFKISFNTSDSSSQLNVHIIDMLGRTVEQLEDVTNTTTLSASSLSNGLYFVKIQNENGKVIGVKKLIVKH